METTGQEGLKSRKLKTIIVATIAFVVILAVGIWAISGALNSGKKTDKTKETETSKTEEKKEENKNEETTVVADPTNATSPSEQYNSGATTENAPVAAAPVVENNNIPQTGASEVVFSALMLGVVASLVALNVQLVKENQNR